jgi:hypothetical protein
MLPMLHVITTTSKVRDEQLSIVCAGLAGIHFNRFAIDVSCKVVLTTSLDGSHSRKPIHAFPHFSVSHSEVLLYLHYTITKKQKFTPDSSLLNLIPGIFPERANDEDLVGTVCNYLQRL